MDALLAVTRAGVVGRCVAKRRATTWCAAPRDVRRGNAQETGITAIPPRTGITVRADYSRAVWNAHELTFIHGGDAEVLMGAILEQRSASGDA